MCLTCVLWPRPLVYINQAFLALIASLSGLLSEPFSRISLFSMISSFFNFSLFPRFWGFGLLLLLLHLPLTQSFKLTLTRSDGIESRSTPAHLQTSRTGMGRGVLYVCVSVFDPERAMICEVVDGLKWPNTNIMKVCVLPSIEADGAWVQQQSDYSPVPNTTDPLNKLCTLRTDLFI